MRLAVYVSSQRTRRVRYSLSDSKTDDSVQVTMSDTDLVEYLRVKQEYEGWQQRIGRAKRYGGGWV